MKIPLLLLFLCIISIIIAMPTIVFADDDLLTPEQLVLLMKASREQYNTFDARMKARSCQQVDDEAEPKLRFTREIISRWTGQKRFSKIIHTDYPDIIPYENFEPITIRTYAITPQWSKRLREKNNRTPQAQIKPGTSLEKEQAFYTIRMAMWDLFNWSWGKMNLDETTIDHDKDHDLYIMKVKMGHKPTGPSIILYIDPSKNYIPVKREFVKHDGTLLIRFECSDLRQTENGLWIPYRYNWYDPKMRFSAFYEVEEVSINKPIPDKLLDFSFPSGTVVVDEICQLRYKIDHGLDEGLDEVMNDIDAPRYSIIENIDESDLLKKEDIVVAKLVKEEELLASASKIKEFLVTPPNTKNGYQNIHYYLIGIIVLASIMVLLMRHVLAGVAKKTQ